MAVTDELTRTCGLAGAEEEGCCLLACVEAVLAAVAIAAVLAAAAVVAAEAAAEAAATMIAIIALARCQIGSRRPGSGDRRATKI